MELISRSCHSLQDNRPVIIYTTLFHFLIQIIMPMLPLPPTGSSPYTNPLASDIFLSAPAESLAPTASSSTSSVNPTGTVLTSPIWSPFIKHRYVHTLLPIQQQGFDEILKAFTNLNPHMDFDAGSGYGKLTFPFDTDTRQGRKKLQASLLIRREPLLNGTTRFHLEGLEPGPDPATHPDWSSTVFLAPAYASALHKNMIDDQEVRPQAPSSTLRQFELRGWIPPNVASESGPANTGEVQNTQPLSANDKGKRPQKPSASPPAKRQFLMYAGNDSDEDGKYGLDTEYDPDDKYDNADLGAAIAASLVTHGGPSSSILTTVASTSSDAETQNLFEQASTSHAATVELKLSRYDEELVKGLSDGIWEKAKKQAVAILDMAAQKKSQPEMPVGIGMRNWNQTKETYYSIYRAKTLKNYTVGEKRDRPTALTLAIASLEQAKTKGLGLREERDTAIIAGLRPEIWEKAQRLAKEPHYAGLAKITLAKGAIIYKAIFNGKRLKEFAVSEKHRPKERAKALAIAYLLEAQDEAQRKAQQSQPRQPEAQ